jgi:SEC-C motif
MPDPPLINPAEGVTASERYLGELCKRSFLSLWSYPGIYRDQGRLVSAGDGKEVCDLLIVFENHIIIFSDKHCQFPNSGDLQKDWGRWYRRAIRDSAKQVWGAERWIKQFPDCLFLDRECKVRFPIPLPDPSNAIFHRIVVAHDASRRFRELFGGSGSLMIASDVVGDAHLDMPFMIGQVDPVRGYVHVFDDTALEIVMSTLDTITDFTGYLTKKEQFLTGNIRVAAAGEEELLAVYLRKLSASGEHDFVIDGNYDNVVFDEGMWKAFQNRPERLAQIESDKISYAWDDLIEKFAFHFMTGTQYFTSGKQVNEQEIMFRFLAREPRIRRRVLSESLHEVLERSIHSKRVLEARVMPPSGPGDPHYVFLFLRRKEGITDDQYRTVRMNLLADYCAVTKLRFPQAVHIIGIASEAGLPPQRSEDLIYLDASKWGPKDEARAEGIQKEMGILRKVTRGGIRTYEYPVDRDGKPRKPAPPRNLPSRNSPCPCGSRKRFKRCHGKGVIFKKQK